MSDRPESEPPAAHANWSALVEDAAQPWDTLSTRVLFEGRRALTEDRVRLPSGVETTYQYRRRGPRAVFALPVTASGDAVLIRQYRYPLRATITEVVAGGIEPGESVLAAAQREVAEEVGGRGGEWVALPGFYPQPSISGVVFYPFVALGVTLGDMAHEDTETIERVVVPLPEAYRMLEAGEIHDGPSSLTLFHARRLLASRGLL
ncbi:ADP-ribose pyrophosphatase [Deinococcus metalli]|uniref:ADP-ribose pyrophosphatase n=1 Tax=Deinococcus metalli TaxID=1141878 RepID=A0A7W8KIF4_9DEIO|nr:NUDIX hydrolase [Deinococcus metalli]MBB5377611.1 ADP-ribose pyrophosphatase [Deinococcus metalli]GHF52044.1 DNA mismatch repair protein MutT [Deinococcus metalli]